MSLASSVLSSKEAILEDASKQLRTSHREISIEFEVVAVNARNGGIVANRWMSSVGSGSSTNNSTFNAPQSHERKLGKRKNHTSDNSLDDFHTTTSASDGTSKDAHGNVSGDVDLLSPIETTLQRGELNDNGIDDGTYSVFLPSLSMTQFRKATQPSQAALVPIAAYITFPKGTEGQHGEVKKQRQHPANTKHDAEADNGIAHLNDSAPSLHHRKKSGKGAMKIKKGTDKANDDSGDGETGRSNHVHDDDDDVTPTIKDSVGHTNYISDSDDNHYLNNKRNGASSSVNTLTAQPTTTIMTHIMLPVKYSPGDNNSGVSRSSTSQPYESIDTRRNMLSNVSYKVRMTSVYLPITFLRFL